MGELRKLELQGYEVIRNWQGTIYENGYEEVNILCHRKRCGNWTCYPDHDDCWNCEYYGDLKEVSVFVEYGE